MLLGNASVKVYITSHAEVVYSGFRTNNITVQVLSIAAVSTQCEGAMCDKQDLYRKGRIESKCLCIINIQRLCATTIVIQLQINNAGDEEIKMTSQARGS